MTNRERQINDVIEEYQNRHNDLTNDICYDFYTGSINRTIADCDKYSPDVNFYRTKMLNSIKDCCNDEQKAERLLKTVEMLTALYTKAVYAAAVLDMSALHAHDKGGMLTDELKTYAEYIVSFDNIND